MSDIKRILFIDDHASYREGMKMVIENSSNFEIVGQAATGKEGITLAAEIRPDVVIVDMELPDIHGVQVIKKITAKLPDTHVMVLSAHMQIDYIVKSIKAGAKGYMLKASDAASIIKCLESVAKGDESIDGSLIPPCFEHVRYSDEHTELPDKIRRLTKREQDVIRLLVRGFSMKEISRELKISMNTVKTHKANIMKKTEVKNTVELIRHAVKAGLD